MILRGKRVILDRDLAAIYGVTTARLNEAAKRNLRRFPNDFMFRLLDRSALAAARAAAQVLQARVHDTTSVVCGSGRTCFTARACSDIMSRG